ncbi:MAG TPA: hypothetical protein DC058_12695 [Planctomycetaceae bacterium]|nr:hypothetical protein [Planctomycetaceae bacterium]HBC62057.1 hypothetical protein [Planctomycetaceae bacterium]
MEAKAGRIFSVNLSGLEGFGTRCRSRRQHCTNSRNQTFHQAENACFPGCAMAVRVECSWCGVPTDGVFGCCGESAGMRSENFCEMILQWQ